MVEKWGRTLIVAPNCTSSSSPLKSDWLSTMIRILIILFRAKLLSYRQFIIKNRVENLAFFSKKAILVYYKMVQLSSASFKIRRRSRNKYWEVKVSFCLRNAKWKSLWPKNWYSSQRECDFLAQNCTIKRNLDRKFDHVTKYGK